MTRTPFVVGNWKLNKTVAEALALVTDVKNQLAAVKGVAYGVAPTFAALWPVARRLEDSAVALVAQNCHWDDRGAFTGEVSPSLLADVGCQWVIVGHSERRQFFGDTSENVGKKAHATLAAGLGAILCCGETDRERDANRTFAVVDDHLNGGLASVKIANAAAAEKLVIAYEPVWAIGPGRTATPQQAQEVHRHIRGRLTEKFGGQVAAAIRIQYGGSVKPSNAESLMAEPDIDGALVGGASLLASDFVAIVKAARSGS